MWMNDVYMYVNDMNCVQQTGLWLVLTTLYKAGRPRAQYEWPGAQFCFLMSRCFIAMEWMPCAGELFNVRLPFC